MANPLLLFHVYVEVAYHHDAARRPDALFATRELAGGHVTFEDVHAVLLVERDARHLIEANHVVETHESPLATGHVYEHLRDRRLAARYQVRVRRNLLVQVALGRTGWAEFYEVVIPLDERDHTQEPHHLRPVRQRLRLHADRAKEEVLPFGRGESLSSLHERHQHVRLGELDRPQALDAEWPAVLFLGNRRIVSQRHLGVETVAEHSLVFVDKGVGNPHVLQAQTREFHQERVGLRIQSGLNDVYQFDRALLSCPCLEQLLLAGPDRPVLKLPLDDP